MQLTFSNPSSFNFLSVEIFFSKIAIINLIFSIGMGMGRSECWFWIWKRIHINNLNVCTFNVHQSTHIVTYRLICFLAWIWWTKCDMSLKILFSLEKFFALSAHIWLVLKIEIIMNTIARHSNNNQVILPFRGSIACVSSDAAIVKMQPQKIDIPPLDTWMAFLCNENTYIKLTKNEFETRLHSYSPSVFSDVKFQYRRVRECLQTDWRWKWK